MNNEKKGFFQNFGVVFLYVIICITIFLYRLIVVAVSDIAFSFDDFIFKTVFDNIIILVIFVVGYPDGKNDAKNEEPFKIEANALNEKIQQVVSQGYVNVSNCSVIPTGRGSIVVNEKTMAGGITGWLGEGSSSVTNCHVENLDITSWTSVGSITGLLHYNNVMDNCSAKNVVLTKTRTDGFPAIGAACGNWVAKANNADYNTKITNCNFDNIELNGSCAITEAQSQYDFSSLYGAPYSASTSSAFKVTLDNNVVTNITDNVKYQTSVSTTAELKASLNQGKDVILTADIEVSEPLQITKDVKIKGNGKKVTLTSSDRAFNVTGADVDNVEISDITINVESDAIESRGVSFYNTKDVKATLNNVTIEGKAYYAINVASLNENLNIEINDSNISGWSVFNLWSENTNVVVNNSILTGINNRYNNAEYPHANDFAVIQFNDNGTTTAKDSKIELNDCEVNAVQGSDQWSAKEYHLVDNTNGLATFVSNNTTFKLNGVETSIIKG